MNSPILVLRFLSVSRRRHTSILVSSSKRSQCPWAAAGGSKRFAFSQVEANWIPAKYSRKDKYGYCRREWKRRCCDSSRWFAGWFVGCRSQPASFALGFSTSLLGGKNGFVTYRAFESLASD